MELYKGYPLRANITLEEMIEEGWLEKVQPVEDDFYILKEPGIYSCHMDEENAYHMLKIFSVKKDDLQFHLQEKFQPQKLVLTEDGYQDGWQPTGYPKLAPEGFRRDQRDMMLCIWPDEILSRFSGMAYTETPETPENHQVMNQQDLLDRLAQLDAICPYMTLYSLGQTKNLNMEIPAAVFTTAEPGAFHDKITVWYQAQVHGNEPASCDGALEIMERMANDPAYRQMLEHLNLIVIPRVNPDGSYLYRRMTFDSIDINRDHLAEDAWETRLLHQAFNKCQPEVVLDGHEFISFECEENESGTVTKRGWDLMTSAATSLNLNDEIRQLALDLCGETFDHAKAVGLTMNHFGTTDKNSIGRAYFGLHQCLSFLIETRGIGTGKYLYPRRVFAQVETITAYLQAVVDHAEEIKAVVRKARDPETHPTTLVLQQEASGETKTGFWGIGCKFNLNGELQQRPQEEKNFLAIEDKILRQRAKPQAYLLSSSLSNIDRILAKLDNMGIQYQRIPAGTTLKVQPYENLGQRPEGQTVDDILAELDPLETKTFEQDVYLFPTSQPGGMVLAMLMEPDVTDSAGTRGTLFQQGLLACHEIYRLP